MPQTTNKGYEIQTTGSNTNTWGTVLNDSALSVIDRNLGATASVTITSASPNATLTSTQPQAAIVVIGGAMGATNGVVTTSCVGFFFCWNNTTGTGIVTLNNGSGTAVIDRGVKCAVLATALGIQIIGENFGTNTSIGFFQTATPTGWTRQTSLNDALIRLTSGTASSGGTNNFTTINSSLMLAQANLPNVNLTTSPSGTHTHDYDDYGSGTNPNAEQNAGTSQNYADRTEFTSRTSDPGGNHTHTAALNGGVTQTAVNLNIKYIDVSRGTKA